MEKIKKLSNKTITYLLPLAFLQSGFLGGILLTIAYPYFNSHENVRIAISLVFSIVLWLVLLFNILINLNKHSRKEIGGVILFVVICFSPFIIALIKFGFKTAYIVMAGRYGIFVVMYIFIAIILNRDKSYKAFISSFKWYGVALIPFVIFYISRMFRVATKPNENINIGGMSYTMVASILILVLMASIVEIADADEKHHQAINWILIVLFGLAIIYSGSRSMLICLLTCVVLAVLLFARKEKKSQTLKLVFVAAIVFAMYLFSANVWAPVSSGMGADGRGSNMISGETAKAQDRLPTNNPNDLTTIFFNEIVSSEDSAENTIDRVKRGILNDEIYQEQLAAGYFSKKEVEKYSFYTVRLNLFAYAWSEFQRSPVKGQGVLYYQNKYGTYPHNWLLENLCDLGIVFTGVVTILIVIIVIEAIIVTKRNTYVRGIIFICLSQIPFYMLSGSIYLCNTLSFAIVFATTYAIKYGGGFFKTFKEKK